MLITLTTMASLIPLAVGTSATTRFGAIALATAGGTVAGTLGALLVLPCLVMGWGGGERRRRRAQAPPLATGDPVSVAG